MLRKIASFICLFILILTTFFLPQAYAWAPVAHYHINNQAKSDFTYQEIYAFNGTGPDMFNFLKEWPEYVHSPNPKEEKVEGEASPNWESSR